MKIGLIGLGSIGLRHAKNLLAQPDLKLTALRQQGVGNDLQIPEISDRNQFFSEAWDAIILCNATAQHFDYLSKELLRVPYLFVEKPICRSAGELEQIRKLYRNRAHTVMVGMNLRFHPIVQAVQNFLREEAIGKIYSSRFFVGQYLPDWRPQRRYQESYSAQSSQGGGVALDLIHEIDLAHHLLGSPRGKIQSIAGRFGELEIDVEDTVEILYSSEKNGLVSIHMDYLRRGYERHFEIYGSAGSLQCDLQALTLQRLGRQGEVLERRDYSSFERNDMYRAELQAFLRAVKEHQACQPSISEAFPVMEIALSAKGESLEKHF